VFIEQGVRRETMLEVIEGARQRLVLSLFRCLVTSSESPR
jgi:hypothetical protein